MRTAQKMATPKAFGAEGRPTCGLLSTRSTGIGGFLGIGSGRPSSSTGLGNGTFSPLFDNPPTPVERVDGSPQLGLQNPVIVQCFGACLLKTCVPPRSLRKGFPPDAQDLHPQHFADTNGVLLFKRCWNRPVTVEICKNDHFLQFPTCTEHSLRNIPCIIVLLEVYFFGLLLGNI